MANPLDNVWYVDDPQYGVVPLGANNSTFGATVVLPPVTVPSGALIVVAVSENSAVSGTLSDGGTNTYGKTSNSPISWNAAGEVVNIFFVANAAALSGATFTYTKGTSGVNASIAALYVPNVASASAEDTAVANSATGNSASASVTSNAPTQNADLLVGVVSENANGLPGSATGWNTIAQSGVALVGITLYAGGVRGGLAPSVLTASVVSGQWVASIVGFKYASAPGGYSGVSGWKASNTQICGDIIRQSDLSKVAVGSERCFVCYSSTGGTGQTAASEPTITATRGAQTTDNTVKWQEITGQAALNGDTSSNTPTWTQYRTANSSSALGQVIQSGDGTKILLATTAGAMASIGSEPSWSAFTNAGATTNDGAGAVWTTIAAVPSGFPNWGAPHARLANSIAWNAFNVPNNHFMATEHYELQASQPVIQGGSSVNPINILCVTKSNVPPTDANMSSGATIATIGGNNNITFGGYLYFEAGALPGISVMAGNAANSVSITIGNNGNAGINFKNCTLALNNTGGSSVFKFMSAGVSGNDFLFDNCNFIFGSNSSQNFTLGSANSIVATFRKCNFTVGANIPTTLFSQFCPTMLTLEECDLSGFTSKTLLGNNANNGWAVIKDCKLPATVTISAAITNDRGRRVDLIRSDSSGTSYKHQTYQFSGTQTTETTIVRTGGATDGTTPLSWNIATNSQTKWVYPFVSIPITVWVNSTGSHTLTVYGTTTVGGVPKDDEIWVDVEYLGSGSSPQGSITTTTKSSLLGASSAVNNSSDGSTWGGAGAGNGFKIVTPSFTVNQIGYINVTIKAAKATSTYYVDPELVVN